MGAPLPGAPPCILQRRFPRTAGDWQGYPLRVRAPQRSVRCMGNSSQCIGSFLRSLFCRFRRVDGTDNSLTAGVDMDVFDRDLLLTLAAVAVERVEQRRRGAGSLFAWLKFSRRSSNVCSESMARP